MFERGDDEELSGLGYTQDEIDSLSLPKDRIMINSATMTPPNNINA